jgi:hypothetical protein
MEHPKDGGPAFPAKAPVEIPAPNHLPDYMSGPTFTIADFPGMSLRDWFAGQGLRARWGNGSAMTEMEAARMAYQIADAMLEARKD